MGAFAGITGAVTSWANNTQLITTGSEPMAFTLNLEGQEFDSTAFAAAGIRTWIKGLSSWSGTISQRFKTASTGDLGLVTFTAGYTTNLNSWDLAVEVDELETTVFGATSRAYIPGALRWGGTFSGYQDDSTPLTMPGNSSEPATGTFKLREAGATDDTLSGSIFTTLANASVDPNSVASVTYTYRGSGDLTQSTPSAGTTVFATGTVARPTAGSLVLTAVSGQTFTGSAFWTRVAITVGVNRLCTVEVNFRGSGDLTIG